MSAVRQEAPSPTPRTYHHLLRAARRMFQPDELERLVPRTRGGPRLADVNGEGAAGLDPIAATEAISYDFLGKGGKYSRPFITLAAYDALTGGHCTRADGAEQVPGRITDTVCRAALSIEAFHKASLVHDDIQDGDEFRYGRPTVHIEHGVPTAINVGDYLIGLGYRLVSRDTEQLGADTAADILNKLADAHTRLSEGQGAELVWRDGRDKRITPTEALKIYALKTAPAFEAALYCGVRLAGPAEKYAQPVHQLSRHLGIAFQILNDLQDWQGDDFNKLTLGGDVLGGRPTVLWALALEGLEHEDRRQLERLVAEGEATPAVFAEIRRLFQRAGAFDGAVALVEEHRRKAQAVAERLEPEALRRLAHYLIETVLARPATSASPHSPGSSHPVTTDPARHLAEAELYTRSASRLASLFFSRLDEIGRFEPVAADDLPPAARDLLAHHEHMTVAHETQHESPVAVRAVDEWQDESSYARVSLLSRQTDGAIIQFGIMRIWLDDLPQDARREITDEKQPLGRVLINHNLLREVELIALWRITPGPVLKQHLQLTDDKPVYGRSAQILVDERPTVQVLEIVKLAN